MSHDVNNVNTSYEHLMTVKIYVLLFEKLTVNWEIVFLVVKYILSCLFNIFVKLE